MYNVVPRLSGATKVSTLTHHLYQFHTKVTQHGILVEQIKKFNMDSIYKTGSRGSEGALKIVACNLTV